jgi:hypothetical protein
MDIPNTELDVHLSLAMSFNAVHDNEEHLQPITPVLKCEEGTIEAMSTLFIVLFQSNQNRNQRESINYKSMAKVWNSQCFSECLTYTFSPATKNVPKNTSSSQGL